MMNPMMANGIRLTRMLRLLPSAMPRLATALREALAGDRAALESLVDLHDLDRGVVDALRGDLDRNRGKALVVAGGHLSEETHLAVASLNVSRSSPAVSPFSPSLRPAFRSPPVSSRSSG